jgi:AraC-like DNA-binding protein
MPILPQVAMPFVRLLYKFWIDHKVPKQALDDILGFDITVDGGEKFGVSSHKVAQLHKVAVEQAGDPALGIRLGQYIALSDLTIGDILMKSQSLAIGIDALMAHSAMVSESGRFELVDSNDDMARLSFIPHENIIFSCYQKDMVFAAIESWIVNIFPDAKEDMKYFYAGDNIKAIEHDGLLVSPIYAAQDSYLEISNTLMVRINPSADEVLFEQNLVQARKVISKRIQRLELYAAVRSAIKECLLQRCATQENVANQLNLSIRNLQRRLKEAGTTYQSILDDSREALALNLIKDLEIPLYEISFLVGFTEPSAFYKAFRRWTGKRPGDYRQDVVQQSTRKVSVNAVLNADESPY